MAAAPKRRTCKSPTRRTCCSACARSTRINPAATGSGRANDGFPPPPPAFGQARPEDFAALLRREGKLPAVPPVAYSAGGQHADADARRRPSSPSSSRAACSWPAIGARRRAISWSTIARTRCWRSIRYSLMAIAGVPATAWEMARVLEHSFQFYRRSQLQEMSLEGKVRALSKLLRDNLGFVMQGVGVVVPLFATYDARDASAAPLFLRCHGRAIRGDGLTRPTARAGQAVRSVLYYENHFGPKPLREADGEGGGHAGAPRAGYRGGNRHRDRRRGPPRAGFSRS